MEAEVSSSSGSAFVKMASDLLRGLAVPHLLPERCYDELFLRFNLLHGEAGSARGCPKWGPQRRRPGNLGLARQLPCW